MKTIIKKSIHSILSLGVLSAILFTSCSKDDDVIDNLSLASEVIGTYSGTLINTSTNDSKPATINVTMQNDSIIQLHCMSTNFESTVILQLYQNKDSIMVCYTGQDFLNEYGHNINNYDFCCSQQSGWTNQNWNGQNWAGGEQWNAWTNHMNTQHNQADLHYGGFSPGMNSCNYRFLINIGHPNHYEVFTGTRSN